MIITNDAEFIGIKNVSEAVAITLREMRNFAKPGLTTKQLDEYGGHLLKEMGAKSAPKVAYNFPGYTCISVNKEMGHGIPSVQKTLQTGDLINIDVSAEMNGFWADNGGSFVLGADLYQQTHLVDTSKRILKKAIFSIKSGVLISDIGRLIETEARKSGYKVIQNLTGHGVGRSLHEAPEFIPNYFDKKIKGIFQKNSVVALETFIATKSNLADTMKDGWTLIGNHGGYVAQHEHTILITDGKPIILTAMNEIWM
jgi:methionyl aminopeptidase